MVVEPYPSEKYEFVTWDDDVPKCFWKVIIHSMVPVTTNQAWLEKAQIVGIFLFSSRCSQLHPFRGRWKFSSIQEEFCNVAAPHWKNWIVIWLTYIKFIPLSMVNHELIMVQLIMVQLIMVHPIFPLSLSWLSIPIIHSWLIQIIIHC